MTGLLSEIRKIVTFGRDLGECRLWGVIRDHVIEAQRPIQTQGTAGRERDDQLTAEPVRNADEGVLERICRCRLFLSGLEGLLGIECWL